MFRHAKRLGESAENPIKGSERLHRGDRAEFVWTEADITKFMETVPVELRHALMLGLFTGQRYGDLIRLRWADQDGSAMSLRQSKTGAAVYVPCIKALKAMLDGMRRRGPFILTRPDGRPWFTENNDTALSTAWREQTRAVGITELHFHDLRGTAVTRMNEAGVSIQQVAAITGYTMESATQILRRHSAQTRRLAEAAIRTRENGRGPDVADRLQTAASEAPGKPKKSEP